MSQAWPSAEAGAGEPRRAFSQSGSSTGLSPRAVLPKKEGLLCLVPGIAMDQTAIASIMNPDVVSVAPDCETREAISLMRERRLSCLVVCEKARPVGILSERDVVRTLSETLEDGEATPHLVSDIMSAPVFTVRETDAVVDAMEALQQRQVRRAPVLDSEGTVTGLVTQGDLLRHYSRELEQQRDKLKKRVMQRNRELKDVNKHLKALSFEDPLLEIGNRRAMVIMLDEIHEICRRYGHVYCLIMFDLDHFKAYNDRYGHQAGDHVLQEVARAIRGTLRRADCLYRYGGEELLALLPETDSTGGIRAAERARAAVEELGIPHADSSPGTVTISCGVSAMHHRQRFADDWNAVIRDADSALYEAKREGRNCLRLQEVATIPSPASEPD